MRRKTGEQNIVQLCPSLRPSEGQILRGLPEAARGGQALRRFRMPSGVPGWPSARIPRACTGLRSGGPTGACSFSALENTPGSAKPGSVSRTSPNFLRNPASEPVLLRCPPSPRLPPQPAELYSPVTASLKWVFSEES